MPAHMRLRNLILWFTVLPMMAQTRLVTFGITGGIPTETPLGQTDSRIPFVIGPTVNVRISSRLSLESGVLFYRLGQEFTNATFLYPQNSVTLVSGTEHGLGVELPFLARYRFLGEHHTWRPFVNAGPAVRRTSLDANQSSSILSGVQLGTSSYASQVFARGTTKWNVDPVAGAGVDFRAGRFHLEPEVRYSYWGAGKNSVVRKNQVDLLLGFRF